MKKYIKWLWVTSDIRKAKFNMFWAVMYIIFFGIIIHEAIADTPWALIGLVFPGGMAYYQWREFKSDTNNQNNKK